MKSDHLQNPPSRPLLQPGGKGERAGPEQRTDAGQVQRLRSNGCIPGNGLGRRATAVGCARFSKPEAGQSKLVQNRRKMPACAHLLPALIDLVDQAGAVVMQVYRSEFSVSRKADRSPVTEADMLAESLIVAALAQLTPDIPIVAEEAAAAGAVPPIGHRFWLVDPLDGTREFEKRNGEFTVNIALVEAGVPVLGVVGAPAVNQLYAGALGLGVTLRDAAGARAVRCRTVPEAGESVLASRSHGDQRALADFLALRRVASIAQAGSSLKLCLIAAGKADLYPRFGRTMEWDIAAGHAVLAAAGGTVVVAADGQPLRYGKPGFENPSFVASGGAPHSSLPG